MEDREVFQEEKVAMVPGASEGSGQVQKDDAVDFGNRKVTCADRQVMWQRRGRTRRGKRGEEVEEIHLKSS